MVKRSSLAIVVPEWTFAHSHFRVVEENQLPPSYSLGPGICPSNSSLPLIRPHDQDRTGFHVPFLRVPGDTLPALASARSVYLYQSPRRAERCVSQWIAQMRGRWANPHAPASLKDVEEPEARANAWWRQPQQTSFEPVPKRSRAQRSGSEGFSYGGQSSSPRSRHAAAIAEAA